MIVPALNPSDPGFVIVPKFNEDACTNKVKGSVVVPTIGPRLKLAGEPVPVIVEPFNVRLPAVLTVRTFPLRLIPNEPTYKLFHTVEEVPSVYVSSAAGVMFDVRSTPVNVLR